MRFTTDYEESKALYEAGFPQEQEYQDANGTYDGPPDDDGMGWPVYSIIRLDELLAWLWGRGLNLIILRRTACRDWMYRLNDDEERVASYIHSGYDDDQMGCAVQAVLHVIKEYPDAPLPHNERA